MQNNNESITLNALVARMQLKRKRIFRSGNGDIPYPVTPLDQEEAQLFDAIHKKFQQRIVLEAHVTAAQADTLFMNAIEPFGKKFVVETLAREVHLLGVPYTYFILNAALSIIILIWTKNTLAYYATVPFIYLVQRIYYSRIKEKRKYVFNEKILRGDIFPKSK